MSESLRRRNAAGTTLIFVATQFCSSLGSTTALSDSAASTIDMYQITEAGAGLPQIENGDKQAPANWPVTLKYCSQPTPAAQKCHFNDPPPTLSCTATIIGEKVIITAAHCLAKPAQDATIHFKPGDITIHCARDNEYQYEQTGSLAHDIALCISEQVLPHDFLYENLYAGDNWNQSKNKIFLLGYGCRDLAHPDKDFGQLYGGTAILDKDVPETDYSFNATGGAVVCDGDSGGAAYLLVNDLHLTGPRSVVGINSANFSPKSQQSLIAKVSGSDFQFIKKTAGNNHICGVDHDAKNCRNAFTQ
jgi:hypothetical protein